LVLTTRPWAKVREVGKSNRRVRRVNNLRLSTLYT